MKPKRVTPSKLEVRKLRKMFEIDASLQTRGDTELHHSPVWDLIHLIQGVQYWTWRIVRANKDGGHGLVLGRQRNWNFG